MNDSSYEHGSATHLECAGPTAEQWAIYIHFPFCTHRCAYCDFATDAVLQVPSARYREAILREWQLRIEHLEPRPITSVFFGGGTPSLWGASHIGAVLDTMAGWAPLSNDAEITLEANPGTVCGEDLLDYTRAGINRLSVGVPALDDVRLQALDRIHDVATARATLSDLASLLDSGDLKSASVDLIFGGPGQTLEDLERDVNGVLDYGLPHLSAYSLTVEPGTPLARLVAAGQVQPPDESLQVDMLEAIPAWTARHGLQRYEVSNHARPDHESRHNLAYWQGAHYLGLGVGAHGFLPHRDGVAGVRYGNVRQTGAWLAQLENDRLGEAMREPISAAMHLDERVLTGLRLEQGLDVRDLRGIVASSDCDDLLRRAHLLCNRGEPLAIEDERIRVTTAGVRRLDGLILDLLDSTTPG